MRLINTTTYEFSEFHGDDIPKYAILSHTWENDEVSFQEWEFSRERQRRKLDMLKLKRRVDWRQKLDWPDVVEGKAEEVGTQLGKQLREELSKSRWFTRSWTLQELLAPSKVVFYSKNWVVLGDKSSILTHVISDITGIDASYLLGNSPITAASVALRMFWISRRRTTRVEDMAYCMLGIFDINMPLLYGEGMKAFVRL
ncbi:hypothetical protein BOTCAL_0130g00120 [Botryotinia calthae]|uniref:Heterokaryon incompatibility domain-containing protein n=1 Tax=Botryotinia calthae TaxID=38488 RepID=A0A4Y8D3W0_9HELO|nr:hypothetical protein BOTCAL_0130g00120 [Botryotinia calthae]